MTDLRGAPSSTDAVSLREFPAAASVIAACLRAQTETPTRSRLGRAFGASPLSDASRKPYVEAIEELRVSEELERLGPEWSVLNSVPVGEQGHTIDHLAVGPGGIFAIEVVHQPGAAVAVNGDLLTVNGALRPRLTHSRALATEAAVDLTRSAGCNAPVRGLLVFVGPQSLSVHDEPDDVGVTSCRGLHKWLAARPRLLDADDVVAIADAAAEPSTWRGAARRRIPRFDAEAFSTEAFDALRLEVQRAWAARGFWGAVLIGAAAITALRVFG